MKINAMQWLITLFFFFFYFYLKTYVMFAVTASFQTFDMTWISSKKSVNLMQQKKNLKSTSSPLLLTQKYHFPFFNLKLKRSKEWIWLANPFIKMCVWVSFVWRRKLTSGIAVRMKIMILSRKPRVFITTSSQFAMEGNHNFPRMEISRNEAVNCDKPI